MHEAIDDRDRAKAEERGPYEAKLSEAAAAFDHWLTGRLKGSLLDRVLSRRQLVEQRPDSGGKSPGRNGV